MRTVKEFAAVWSANAAANKPLIKKQVSKLWQRASSKVGVLIAAGPSLSKSIAELKALDQHAHELVAVDMALEYLLQAGIVPDFVISSDASATIQRALQVRFPNRKIPALLLNVVAHSETAKLWPGDIYWYCMLSDIYDGSLGTWMQQDHQVRSSVSSFLLPGGNVSSLGVSFLASVRAVKKLLLYGHDFCWQANDEFYCGGVQQELAAERLKQEQQASTIYAVKSTYGEQVLTNGSLLQFASWYADIDRALPGLMENRSPVTILTLGGSKHDTA